MRKNTPPMDILQALHDARKSGKATLQTHDITDLVTYRRLAQDASISIKFDVAITLTAESIPEEPQSLIDGLKSFKDEQEDTEFSAEEKKNMSDLINEIFGEDEEVKKVKPPKPIPVKPEKVKGTHNRRMYKDSPRMKDFTSKTEFVRMYKRWYRANVQGIPRRNKSR